MKYAALFVVIIAVAFGGYALWYSHARSEKIAHNIECDQKLAHPAVVQGPGGAPATLNELCLYQAVPPTLRDLVHGRLVFEGLPERFVVSTTSISLMDIILGRYSLQPRPLLPCDQSATTTDCSQFVVDAFPPAGWFAHEVGRNGGMTTILTRNEVLPDVGATEGYAYGEQIVISHTATDLSPEEYVESVGLVGPSADAFGASSTWSTLEGHRLFSSTFASVADQQWTVLLFGEGEVYDFMLYPNDASNPNLEQDRQDFQSVIEHFAGLLDK